MVTATRFDARLRSDDQLSDCPPTLYEGTLGFDPVFPAIPPPTFPPQFFGLRGRTMLATVDLCLVDLTNAPSGLGGSIRIQKPDGAYAIYLVPTTDPNASPFRVATADGVKAVRLLTS